MWIVQSELYVLPEKKTVRYKDVWTKINIKGIKRELTMHTIAGANKAVCPNVFCFVKSAIPNFKYSILHANMLPFTQIFSNCGIQELLLDIYS